ncbi:MAG: 2OG-Fe(II) oxygenase [Spongiibacteraceae bacterium]
MPELECTELEFAELEVIADDLHTQGFSVCTNFIPGALVAGLMLELQHAAAEFRAAGIGRDQVFQRDAEVRSDRIRWLDAQAAAQAEFLQTMAQLQQRLNQRLLLGLADYEAHFAQYAPNAFYRRHRDTFVVRDGDRKPRRIVSSVIYLNNDWHRDDGGELVIYDAGDSELIRVLPQAGSAVFFLSEEFPHEVLPARRERYSIAGWFRRRGG